MNPDGCYRVSDHLTIRKERFGAVLYDFDRRRLSFLRSHLLVRVLNELNGREPLGPTLVRFCREHALPPDTANALERAVEQLWLRGFVVQVSGPGEPTPPPEPAAASGPAASHSRGGLSSYTMLRGGLAAPICLTWEITYSCNLRCVHCLSSSPRPTGEELTTAQAKRLIDEMAEMQVFYINVGGGEPLVRRDFFDLMEYCVSRRVGVKFSTNGALLDRSTVRRVASLEYVDLQVSLDGATAPVNDAIRGNGSFDLALRGMGRLADEGVPFKINAVMTAQNLSELDELYKLADSFRAELRLTRLRPSGRARPVWSKLHLSAAQQVQLYHWLTAHPDVLTADSFFHLSPLGEQPLEGLNMCGAGRVVCGIDPTGNVYACPFLPDPAFLAGNVRSASLAAIWRDSAILRELRRWEPGDACRQCQAFDVCHGGCHAAKYYNDIPLAEPDPECVASAIGEFISFDTSQTARAESLPLL